MAELWYVAFSTSGRLLYFCLPPLTLSRRTPTAHTRTSKKSRLLSSPMDHTPHACKTERESGVPPHLLWACLLWGIWWSDMPDRPSCGAWWSHIHWRLDNCIQYCLERMKVRLYMNWLFSKYKWCHLVNLLTLYGSFEESFTGFAGSDSVVVPRSHISTHQAQSFWKRAQRILAASTGAPGRSFFDSICTFLLKVASQSGGVKGRRVASSAISSGTPSSAMGRVWGCTSWAGSATTTTTSSSVRTAGFGLYVQIRASLPGRHDTCNRLEECEIMGRGGTFSILAASPLEGHWDESK